jgi:hypothetical protein
VQVGVGLGASKVVAHVDEVGLPGTNPVSGFQ